MRLVRKRASLLYGGDVSGGLVWRGEIGGGGLQVVAEEEREEVDAVEVGEGLGGGGGEHGAVGGALEVGEEVDECAGGDEGVGGEGGEVVDCYRGSHVCWSCGGGGGGGWRERRRSW